MFVKEILLLKDLFMCNILVPHEERKAFGHSRNIIIKLAQTDSHIIICSVEI